MMGPLGIHIPLGRGYVPALEEIDRLGIDCCQIFTSNPRSWSFKPIDQERVRVFREGLSNRGISPIVSHTGYLINLGNGSERSAAALREEIRYARAFGCTHLVLHVGKHLEASRAVGLANVVQGLNGMAPYLGDSAPRILLETVAGQGTELGATFEELAIVLNGVNDAVRAHLGVCFDTCHVFAAGYDLRSPAAVKKTLAAFDRAIGLRRLELLHMNDSARGLGERRDRHAHIGYGAIGREGFRALLTHPKLRQLPKILETPVDERGDKENIAMIRSLEKSRKKDNRASGFDTR